MFIPINTSIKSTLDRHRDLEGRRPSSIAEGVPNDDPENVYVTISSSEWDAPARSHSIHTYCYLYLEVPCGQDLT